VVSVLPKTKAKGQFTLLVVVGVTVLSTIAMLIYPLILQALEIGSMDTGIFTGTTIHAVAQVVAAGMLFGPEAGDVSTLVKLFRVVLLLPVVIVISFSFASQSAGNVGLQNFKSIPLFLLGFVTFLWLHQCIWCVLKP
jgi:uncharacterized membrane protein YadS